MTGRSCRLQAVISPGPFSLQGLLFFSPHHVDTWPRACQLLCEPIMLCFSALLIVSYVCSCSAPCRLQQELELQRHSLQLLQVSSTRNAFVYLWVGWHWDATICGVGPVWRTLLPASSLALRLYVAL